MSRTFAKLYATSCRRTTRNTEEQNFIHKGAVLFLAAHHRSILAEILGDRACVHVIPLFCLRLLLLA
jgi:hypothetical protein